MRDEFGRLRKQQAPGPGRFGDGFDRVKPESRSRQPAEPAGNLPRPVVHRNIRQYRPVRVCRDPAAVNENSFIAGQQGSQDLIPVAAVEHHIVDQNLVLSIVAAVDKKSLVFCLVGGFIGHELIPYRGAATGPKCVEDFPFLFGAIQLPDSCGNAEAGRDNKADDPPQGRSKSFPCSSHVVDLV